MARSVPEWIGKNDDQMPPLSMTVRLLEKQGDKCADCGRPFVHGVRVNRDHVIPLADGGENREANFQLLCNWCHVEKTSAEATSRAKTNRIKLKGLSLDRTKTNRWQSAGFRKAPPQRTATRRLANKFEDQQS